MKQKIVFLVVLLLLAELTAFVQPSKKSNLPSVAQLGKEVQAPKSVYVPKLNLFLSLQTAPIKNGVWVLNEQKTAFFGQGSALPGKKGTTAIFAHAKKGLFSELPILKKGDSIMVFSDTKVFRYEIREKQLIEADNLSFLGRNKNNQVALFTCFGKNDEKRIVFTADLITSKPISNLKFLRNVYRT